MIVQAGFDFLDLSINLLLQNLSFSRLKVLDLLLSSHQFLKFRFQLTLGIMVKRISLVVFELNDHILLLSDGMGIKINSKSKAVDQTKNVKESGELLRAFRVACSIDILHSVTQDVSHVANHSRSNGFEDSVDGGSHKVGFNVKDNR